MIIQWIQLERELVHNIVPVVQPLVGQSDVPKTSPCHVHSPPKFYPLVIEGEINATLLTPE